MISLSTPVASGATPPALHFGDPVMSLGSCFSECIANHLGEGGMNVLTNPFGIQYNPLSIARTLERILEGHPFTEAELVCHNGLYHSWLHHGSFSSEDATQALLMMNRTLSLAHERIHGLRYLILTWGTSYVYRHALTGEVVSNCHKHPEKTFLRERASLENLVEAWHPLLTRLFALCPELKLILTVSPIRHLRDGAHENTLSKATLHLFTDELCRLFPERCHYFPSYEILLDELRDYRFFAEDLTHPSRLAERVIAERLTFWLLDASTQQAFAEALRLTKELRHRPLHEGSTAHTARLTALRAKVSDFLTRYPEALLPLP